MKWTITLIQTLAIPMGRAARVLLLGGLAWGGLALGGCAGRAGEGDGWRPFHSGAPSLSFGGDRPPPGFGASRVTVPRVTVGVATVGPLQEEDGDVWPARQPPRVPVTDPDSVGRTTGPAAGRRRVPAGPIDLHDPNPFDPAPLRPLATPPPVATPPGIGGGPGVRGFSVPGRDGVGTAFPDGRGGSILVNPDGSVTVAPR